MSTLSSRNAASRTPAATPLDGSTPISAKRSALRPYYAFESELWSERERANLHFRRFERFLDRPVILRGPEGSHDEHRVSNVSVLRYDNRFVGWYTAMRCPHANVWRQFSRTTVCVACSEDGVHWEKPELGLVPTPHELSPNNIVPIPVNSYGVGVTHDGLRYIMKCEFPREAKLHTPNTTFCVLTSKDGLHWAGPHQPVTHQTHFESSNSIYCWNERYFVMGQSISPYFEIPGHTEFGRTNFVFYSDDLETWKLFPKPAYAYPVPRHFPDSSLQVHTGACAVDRGRLVLGFMGQFWPSGFSETVRSTIGLIYSYDGLNWREPFVGEPFLLPDEDGWDCGMLMQGNGLYSKGAYTYYWYNGLDDGNLWTSRSAVGICRIRRDGFAYFAATDNRAVVTTHPIDLAEDDAALYLNADAASGSVTSVEILDAHTGKSLDHVMVEQTSYASKILDLSNLPGKPAAIKLRFTLPREVKMYGFYVASRDFRESAFEDYL